MGKMIAVKEIEQEFGVPTYIVKSAVRENMLEYKKINRLILIDAQDAEKIIFEYHVRQNGITWTQVAEKFNASKDNKILRKLADSILPHYKLPEGTYYPVSDVEDVAANMEQYHIKKYKNKYYYMEGGREDYYITNYFTMLEFKQAFEQKYGMKTKLRNFSAIKKQLNKMYPVETVNLFGFPEYMIPREYMVHLMEDYYIFYTVRNEKNPYERYKREAGNICDEQGRIGNTLKLFDEFTQLQMSKTKNQLERAIVMASLKKYLFNILDKEIYFYENDEICSLLKRAKISQRENAQLCLFLKYVLNKNSENCTYDVEFSPKNEAKIKTMQDFYTKEEWLNFINFIFNIDMHIEKAFSNILYAKYWLYCMLQCSLAWRMEDILDMPSLNMKDICQYSVEWFEQNKFTRIMAWTVINTAKKFIEQDRVNKTGAKKHFIILNSFAVATAIGFIICEKHRQDTGTSGLFGKLTFNYETMTRQLGHEIEGFSNLKATRTILSFANETASNMDYSSQAISIASYMRSHITGENGFTDTTSIYLKSFYDENELVSLPAKMGELGLFGWLYKEILIAMDKESKYDNEELIGTIRESITPVRLEGYSSYLLQEQKTRNEIITEVMDGGADKLMKLCAELQSGSSQAKKEHIYCVKPSCQYPTVQDCELCEYAVPSIHALHVIGQEALALLDRLINGEGTDMDRERYSYQLFKLLTILKEAKEEFGENLCLHLQIMGLSVKN